MQPIRNFILIDDDPICNLVVSRLIGKVFPGINIDAFTRSDMGIEYIRDKYSGPNADKAILLLDINMPVLSGWDVLDALAVLPAAQTELLTIYILSSSIAHHDKEKARQYPFISAFWTKPLSTELLRSIEMI